MASACLVEILDWGQKYYSFSLWFFWVLFLLSAITFCCCQAVSGPAALLSVVFFFFFFFPEMMWAIVEYKACVICDRYLLFSSFVSGLDSELNG